MGWVKSEEGQKRRAEFDREYKERMGEENLKPCPFCGGKAFMWSWNGGTRIDCENWSGKDEQTHYVGVGARTKAEAIKAWNTRAKATVEAEGENEN